MPIYTVKHDFVLGARDIVQVKDYYNSGPENQTIYLYGCLIFNFKVAADNRYG